MVPSVHHARTSELCLTTAARLDLYSIRTTPLLAAPSHTRPCFFFLKAEDGIRDSSVTGVQTCALPICLPDPSPGPGRLIAAVAGQRPVPAQRHAAEFAGRRRDRDPAAAYASASRRRHTDVSVVEIGRASCRERV